MHEDITFDISLTRWWQHIFWLYYSGTLLHGWLWDVSLIF